MRGTRTEVSTVGFNSMLQGIGGDLACSPYDLGLQIPVGVPSTSGITCGQQRYTFLLARYSVKAAQIVRLVGLRQLLTIRALVENEETGCVYPLEKLVTSPFWRFVNGSVSWHVRRMGPQTNMGIPGSVANGDSFAILDSTTPALLGGSIIAGDTAATYIGLTAIPGDPVIGDLGTFYGLRFPWIADHAQFSLDYEVRGPCDLAFYASVLQSETSGRCQLVLPDTFPAGTDSLPEEDAFVANFSNAVYGRIAGAMIIEEAGTWPCP